MSKKPVILTGLRANADLHIGNYFGALLPLIDMAKTKAGEYRINLFVPDLHSFTTPIDHSKLQEQIMHNLKLFVAAGLPLDNKDVNIYRQSYIPAHSELTVILNSFTGYSEMGRMTQFKDKAGFEHTLSDNDIKELLSPIAKGENKPLLPKDAHSLIRAFQDRSVFPDTSVGLFDYPVLMACDILLYDAVYVPVGDDQTQHLEYTRDIAQRMNSKFGQELFTVPHEVKKQHEFFGKDQGLRIKDLQDPDKKMSKSDESEKGIIFLGDRPEEAGKKIMSAATDNVAKVQYDPENQPGIANLLQIYGLLSGKSAEEAAKEFEGKSQYGEFKKVVADQVAEFLKEFQAKLANVEESEIKQKLQASENEMNKTANETLLRVQKAVGLR
ncbi:tryptophan--tRNA ligase [Candidatus Parcubacteria bacterium]|nr:tryptophan--tRNA ligase [Candidatus Parcubacteria bacterium]